MERKGPKHVGLVQDAAKQTFEIAYVALIALNPFDYLDLFLLTRAVLLAVRISPEGVQQTHENPLLEIEVVFREPLDQCDEIAS